MSTTASKTKPSRFISKGAHFQIIYRPPRNHMENGLHVLDDAGEILDFGTPFRVEGSDLPVGTYVTDDPVKIEWLRNAASFNVEFWEAGNEPDALHPTIAEIAPLIARATAELDTDKLAELLEAEKASHGRADVVTMIESALEALESPPEPTA